MRVGSLFSGVGGLDLGLERAGMTVAWQCEKDKQAREVLRRHWPDVPIYEDVHDVVFRSGAERVAEGDGPNDLRTSASVDAAWEVGDRTRRADVGSTGSVDVICGGFPCQDYSVAGQRGGLAGDRGALWWEMHRIIAECRPEWVVGENVPGLLSSNGGRDFLTIIESLVQLGYGVTWATLDSQYFGVAQRRRRLFIVGHLGGEPRPEVLALSEGLFGHPAPSREAGAGTAESVGGGIAHTLRAGGFDASEDGTGRGTPIVEPTIVSNGDASSGFRDERGIVLMSSGQANAAELTEDIAPTLNLNRDGAPIAFHSTSVHHMGCRDDGLGPTLKVGSGIGITGTASVVDRAIPRRLTPLECERLQGFPDGWTEYYVDGSRVADGPRYRMMGNAVTVNVAEWIGRRIVACGRAAEPVG